MFGRSQAEEPAIKTGQLELITKLAQSWHLDKCVPSFWLSGWLVAGRHAPSLLCAHPDHDDGWSRSRLTMILASVAIGTLLLITGHFDGFKLTAAIANNAPGGK